MYRTFLRVMPALFALASISLSITPALAQGNVTEFTNGLSPDAEAHGIVTGPDGNLWFTEAATAQIGKITLSPSGTPTITQPITLPNPFNQTNGSQPQAITVGSDGNLWFTERAMNQIGQVNPKSGQLIKEWTVPTGSAATYYDVNSDSSAGLGLDDIVSGPDGNLWFTETNDDKIGKITTSGQVTEYPLSPGAHPGQIIVGPDGQLWFGENGFNAVGEMDTNGNLVAEHPLGTSYTAGAVGINLAVGSDNNVWVDENTQSSPNSPGQVIVLNSSGTVINSFPLSEHVSGDMLLGPDGNIWLSQGNTTTGSGGELAVFTPTTTGQPAQTYLVPGNNGTPVETTTGPDGNLWSTVTLNGSFASEIQWLAFTSAYSGNLMIQTWSSNPSIVQGAVLSNGDIVQAGQCVDLSLWQMLHEMWLGFDGSDVLSTEYASYNGGLPSTDEGSELGDLGLLPPGGLVSLQSGLLPPGDPAEVKATFYGPGTLTFNIGPEHLSAKVLTFLPLLGLPGLSDDESATLGLLMTIAQNGSQIFYLQDVQDAVAALFNLDPVALGTALYDLAFGSESDTFINDLLQFDLSLTESLATTALGDAAGVAFTLVTGDGPFVFDMLTYGGASEVVSVKFKAVPVPVIAEAGPNFAIAGSHNLVLTVTGSGFEPDAQILWNDIALPTTVLSTKALSAAVPDQDVASPTTATITASNPVFPGYSPTLNWSNQVQFVVMPAAPQITLSMGPFVGTGGNDTATINISDSGGPAGNITVTSAQLLYVNGGKVVNTNASTVVQPYPSSIESGGSTIAFVKFSGLPSGSRGFLKVTVVNSQNSTTQSLPVTLP